MGGSRVPWLYTLCVLSTTGIIDVLVVPALSMVGHSIWRQRRDPRFHHEQAVTSGHLCDSRRGNEASEVNGRSLAAVLCVLGVPQG